MIYKSEFLTKNGWTLTSSKRRGMMKIQRWWKSGRGTMSQDDAYHNERQSQAYKKLEEAKKDVAEAEARRDSEATSNDDSFSMS